MKQVSNYNETGIASWYGQDFHGKLTANGESYDMYSLSAAHKTLPLPTLVRVTNLENGRSIVVRVNDRGPFVKNRLIDLSFAAAKELDYMNKGTARIRVQTLDSKPIIDSSRQAKQQQPVETVTAKDLPVQGNKAKAAIFIQLGAYSSEQNAIRLQQALLSDYPDVKLYTRKIAEKMLYRVRIGPFKAIPEIEKTVISLQKAGYDNAIVVIE